MIVDDIIGTIIEPAYTGCKIRRPAEVLTHRGGSDQYLTCSEVRQWLLPILLRVQHPFPVLATEPHYLSACAWTAARSALRIVASSISRACPAPTSDGRPMGFPGIRSISCWSEFEHGANTRAPQTTNTTVVAGSRFATNGEAILRPLWRGRRNTGICLGWNLTARTRTALTTQAIANSLRTTRILESVEMRNVTKKLHCRFGDFWLVAPQSKRRLMRPASNTWLLGTSAKATPGNRLECGK